MVGRIQADLRSARRLLLAPAALTRGSLGDSHYRLRARSDHVGYHSARYRIGRRPGAQGEAPASWRAGSLRERWRWAATRPFGAGSDVLRRAGAGAPMVLLVRSGGDGKGV